MSQCVHTQKKQSYLGEAVCFLILGQTSKLYLLPMHDQKIQNWNGKERLVIDLNNMCMYVGVYVFFIVATVTWHDVT